MTPGKANDIDTTSFEQRQEEIARLMENAACNEAKIKSLQEEVKKAREEQGPTQMILGGAGKFVDNVAFAVKEGVDNMAGAVKDTMVKSDQVARSVAVAGAEVLVKKYLNL